MTSARSLYNRASAVGPLSLRFVDGLWYVFEVIVLAHFFVLSQVLKSSTIMSDAAAAPAAAPAKAPKKRTGGAAKAKKHADHPKYSDMIKAAVTALKVCNLFLTFLFRREMPLSFPWAVLDKDKVVFYYLPL